MQRIPISIGDRTFPSKKDAKQHFKEMLARYADSQTIGGEDSEDLYGLIERHPEAQEKIGCGIRHFFKAGTDRGTSCFWLRREDESITDFSYPTCVDAKAKSLYQEFAEACRGAVRDDLYQAKVAHFADHGDNDSKVPCDISSERISWNESHLDHKKPMTFQVIVRTFVSASKIKIAKEMLSMTKDAQFTTEFVDRDIKAKFKEYHHDVADLRIIKARNNLSLGSSERITKSRIPVKITR